MDRLDAMETFVAIVDQGSLSAAARAQGRSTAATSRSLAALEAHLGVLLLQRTTRALKLTEAGERYLAVCRRVLAELAEADAVAGSALEAPRGVLTVTAPTLFGALHVRPMIDAYLTRYAEARARLVLVDRVVHVIDEGVDVAVRIAALPDSGLRVTPVGFVRRVLCASPAYLARHGRPREPSDLAAHRCIGFTGLVPGDSWGFGPGPEGGRARQVRVRPVLTVNSAEAAIGSAIDGVGLTCVLSYQVAEALRTGALVTLLGAYEPAPVPVQLVCSAGSGASAKVRAFLALATPRLREALAKGARETPPRPHD